MLPYLSEVAAFPGKPLPDLYPGDLGTRGRYRTVEENTDMWVLRETPGRYGARAGQD